MKIALFCDVPTKAGIHNCDADTVYQVPLNLEAEGLASAILAKFGMPDVPPDLSDLDKSRHENT